MGAMTPEEVRARIARQQDRVVREEVEQEQASRVYCQSMASAAERLMEVVENPEGRLMFGLPSIDMLTRGVDRGEMAMVTGYAHSGKTQLILNLFANNPTKHLLMFTPDEVDQLVFAKLVALSHGMNLERIEESLREGSQQVKEMLRRAAREVYPNVFVVDQTVGFTEMREALQEAEDSWGAPCDGLVYDYLDLLPGEADYTSTKGKSTGMKRFLKASRVPGVIIHQPKRTGAGRGKRIGMDDLHMAGDKEATFVLGVYRKRDDEDLDSVDRLKHENTVSVYLSKNKRPPCTQGEWDFHMDAATGRIREITESDWLRPGMPFRTAQEARDARSLLDSERRSSMMSTGISTPVEIGVGKDVTDDAPGTEDEVE